MSRIASYLVPLRGAGAKRFATLSSAKLVAALLQALLYAIIARELGVGGFGQFSSVLAAFMIAMAFFELGFGTLALRLMREDSPRSSATTMIAVRSVTNCAILGAALIVGTRWADGSQLLLSVGLYAVAETFGNMVQNILIGLRKEGRAILLLIGRRASTVAIVVIPMVAGQGHDIVQFVGIASLFSLLLAYSAPVGIYGRPASARAIVLDRRGFWFASLGTNLRQIDVIVVSLLGGEVIAGYFAAASRIVAPVALFTSSFVQSLVPAMAGSSRSDLENHAFTRRALGYVNIITIGLLLSAAGAPIIVQLVYGPTFFEAWPVLAAFILAAALSARDQCFLAWEYSRGLASYVPKVIWLSAAAYVAALALASWLGSLWAVTIAVVVVASFTHMALWRFFSRAGSGEHLETR